MNGLFRYRFERAGYEGGYGGGRGGPFRGRGRGGSFRGGFRQNRGIYAFWSSYMCHFTAEESAWQFSHKAAK